jgi:hypothetical protein
VEINKMRNSAAVLALIALAGCFRHRVDVVHPTLEGPVSVDVKVNGLDGPLTADGSPLILTWQSKNATECRMTSPTDSGISLSGKSYRIASDHPFYPKRSQTIKVSITCGDGSLTATDSVLVRRQ